MSSLLRDMHCHLVSNAGWGSNTVAQFPNTDQVFEIATTTAASGGGRERRVENGEGAGDRSRVGVRRYGGSRWRKKGSKEKRRE